MEVAKLSAPLNLEVRLVSCNESAIKRCLSSELEETVFSLTHELFMTKHHTVTIQKTQVLVLDLGVHTFAYLKVPLKGASILITSLVRFHLEE